MFGQDDNSTFGHNSGSFTSHSDNGITSHTSSSGSFSTSHHADGSFSHTSSDNVFSSSHHSDGSFSHSTTVGHTTVSHRVTEKVSTVTSAKQTSKRTTGEVTTAPIVTTTESPKPENATEPKPTTDLSQKEIVYEDADGKLKVLYSKDSNIDLKRFKVMSKETYDTYNSSANAEPPDGSADGNNSSNDLFTLDKQSALEELAIMERRMIGEFRRTRAIINGELSRNAPRITLDQVNAIVSSSDSFREIYSKIQETQPYPDYYGGSGFSLVEYWLDDSGEEKILLVLEAEDVVYVHLNNYDWIVR